MIIIISTAITYTTYSMNQITQMAETIGVKQELDVQKISESYEITNLRTDNNQFNMTIQNTGDIPIHLTRLWVENVTDSTWPIAKYDLDVAIASRDSVKNIGQNIGLTALDSQSYKMKIVTERGNTQNLFVNSVGNESLYLNLRATPTLVPTGFSSTVVLEVVNTGTQKLLNLQAEMDSVTPTCITTCSATLVSSVSPTSYASLSPGNVAFFEWVYTIDGEDSGDSVEFTASLVGGVDEVSDTVTIQPVQEAENASVSLESGGLADDALLTDDILIFHMEQDGVPSPGYQLMSSSVEGGTNGLRVDMETKTDSNPISFMTNNGTNSINVPAGDWVASLALRSEPVATGIQDRTEHMIFHFEDGQGVDPDNSQGDSGADLENCGLSQFQQRIQQSADDAEQDQYGSNDVWGSSSDFELVYDGNHQWIGLRWSLDVPQGATISSADIRFRADESNTGSSPDLIIGAEDTDDASAFTTTSHNIDDRWDGTTNTVTSATVVWNNISGWASVGDELAAETTPDLSSIVQEIVDRPGWVSGNHIVFIIKDNSGGSNNNKRTAEHYDGGNTGYAARLTVNYGNTGTPTWQPTAGPHGSGAYYYDGVSMCHRSQNGVTSGDNNHLDNNDNTTALWFRTDGVDQVSSEQMLVFWEGEGDYPTSDYYKISIGSDGTGKVLFEYDVEKGTQTTSCLSTNEYDDGAWYHLVAVRTEPSNNETCDLYITDIDGVATESVIHDGPNSYSSSYLNQDGSPDKWYVASRDETDSYFKGWIDDIMHWNDDGLNSDEAEDLALTNYGTSAHKLNVYLNVTDTDGNFVNGLYKELDVPIPFLDPKDGSSSTDSAYTMYNVTMPVSATTISSGQRVNYTMSFVPSTSTWEALELDMKVDDIGFVDPYPSYMQTPMPDRPFPSYVVYDKTDEMELFVNNVGDDGIYFVYSGTRLSFFSATEGSFASLIHYVNGTNSNWALDINKDSVYIPAGESAQLIFYDRPTDHPCQGSGSSCNNANIIPDGIYSMSAWVNGYSDQGETFGRTVQLGSVTVN